MVPNDLFRRSVSENVHIDLLGSRSHLDLTWPEVKYSNWPFKVKKYMSRTGSTMPTGWCHSCFRISHIQKVNNEKPSPWKTMLFHLMASGAKTIDLRSSLIGKHHRGMKRAPQHFFRILPSEKIAIFSKFDLWWPVVTSTLTWPENDLYKSLRPHRGLYYAIYCLSLRSVVFEIRRGELLKPPPRATNWTF